VLVFDSRLQAPGGVCPRGGRGWFLLGQRPVRGKSAIPPRREVVSCKHRGRRRRSCRWGRWPSPGSKSHSAVHPRSVPSIWKDIYRYPSG